MLLRMRARLLHSLRANRLCHFRPVTSVELECVFEGLVFLCCPHFSRLRFWVIPSTWRKIGRGDHRARAARRARRWLAQLLRRHQLRLRRTWLRQDVRRHRSLRLPLRLNRCIGRCLRRSWRLHLWLSCWIGYDH